MDQAPQDLGALRLNDEHTDFVIVLDGHEIRAHKAVLASRCPVFASMFSMPNCTENIHSRMTVTDVDLDVFKLMLDYIYDKFSPQDLTVELACQLLAATDKVSKSDCHFLLALFNILPLVPLPPPLPLFT